MVMVLVVVVMIQQKCRVEQDEVGMESYRRAQLARDQGVWDKEVEEIKFSLIGCNHCQRKTGGRGDCEEREGWGGGDQGRRSGSVREREIQIVDYC